MADATWKELLARLDEREARADEGGGAARQARQTRLGRLTARERLAALCDPGSFVELGRHVVHRHESSSEQLAANRHPGDGVIAGLARVDGREVAVYAHDPTVLRGALGREASRKVCRLLDLAGEKGCPVVCLADSDGVRVDEGMDAIDAYGEIIRRTVRHKRTILQITLVSGLCVGAAAYTAALGDLVLMVDGQSWMFITGPKVTKVVTGEDVTLDELGGPLMHARKTGQCHAVVKDEREGLAWVKRVLSYLGPGGAPDDPILRPTPELVDIVPTADRRAYDMRKVQAALFDRESLLELSPGFAPNLLTTFARLGGRSVAVLASQPMQLAGCLDVDASRKGAHFVNLASTLGLPVVTLVDVPGYMPGRKQEEGGILPHGALLLDAYGSARVPLVCLVVRKSYGGASVLSFAADVRLALPTARIGPMGADAALEVIVGPEHDKMSDDDRRAREEKRAAWLAAHDHAWAPAESGYVDQVIRPEDARRALGAALVALDRPLSTPPRGVQR
jgi:methylmalonyl-CoA decarboxylase subunit alpha